MLKRTVLVGAGGTGTAFAIISRLRSVWSTDIRIITIDVNEESRVTSSLLVDKFYTVSPANSLAFEFEIANILLDQKVDMFIPILNDEIKVAAGLSARREFDRIDFSGADVFKNYLDKREAKRFLVDVGVPVSSQLSVSELLTHNKVCFAKPIMGYGSHDAKKLTSADLKNNLDQVGSDFILEELCDQPEVTVDSFWDNRLGSGSVYCRERLEVKSGVCTKARLFYDNTLRDYAQKIGTGLDQRGSLCFQVMKLRGDWVVTDLNFRPGAGTAMTCAAGFDLIAAGYACRVGEPYAHFLPQMQPSEEFIITRQYSEFVMRHHL